MFLVEPYLNKISSLDRHVSMILSMIIVFIGVQVVFVAIGHIMDVLPDLTRLTWLDRVLGGTMGLVAGFLDRCGLRSNAVGRRPGFTDGQDLKTRSARGSNHWTGPKVCAQTGA